MKSNRNYFDFGNNWLSFSKKHIDDEAMQAAQESLVSLIGETNLVKKRFLDIGCGSGIFSIAAKRIGADKVVGIDISPLSIEASHQNKKKFYNDQDINFSVASILEDKVKDFGQFDVVYAWGVLHHTGVIR